jgi:hypothetical protein
MRAGAAMESRDIDPCRECIGIGRRLPTGGRPTSIEDVRSSAEAGDGAERCRSRVQSPPEKLLCTSERPPEKPHADVGCARDATSNGFTRSCAAGLRSGVPGVCGESGAALLPASCSWSHRRSRNSNPNKPKP